VAGEGIEIAAHGDDIERGVDACLRTVDEADGAGRVREADLQRHLGNPNGDAEKKGDPAKPAKPAEAAKGGEPGKPAAPANPLGQPPAQAPVEFGSADDGLTKQAVNLLKGVAIIKP
jgi:hypothetical protein